MNELLTTKELQTLLCIDRKTVYRMLKDEKLPAVRVGGQWRFPRHAIEIWLHEPQTVTDFEVGPDEPNGEVLPLDCFTSVQEVFAEAVQVGAVTTDREGKPLTPVSNNCAFCQLILASPEGRKRCQDSWRRLGNSSAEPRLERCHAGLAYARARIEVGDEFVAMVFAGQFLVNPAQRKQLNTSIRAWTKEFGIPEKELRAAAEELHLVDPAQAEKILRLLAKVADTFSQIGRRRLDLLMRLRRVAKLATV